MNRPLLPPPGRPTAAKPIVFGAKYSVYTQALLICLLEKQVRHHFVEVDILPHRGAPSEHLRRHPFGRIPSFQHDALAFYETAPICRYVDEAFDGPALQPPTPVERARMGQAISIADNYAFRSMVLGLYVDPPEQPPPPDDPCVSAALELSAVCLKALENLAPDSQWIAGDVFTLADLHAAPMFALFSISEHAADLMVGAPRLADWFERVRQRPSVRRVLGASAPRRDPLDVSI